ncbi:MAG TPA: hypothetical protein VLE03_01175 [Nitrospiraceae bacterium]|nr:hypothetical protein [Nitrospiraceae bacterium]
MRRVLRGVEWLLIALGLSACASLTGERIIYDQQGIRISIESDRSVNRSTPPAPNSHPAAMSPDDVRVLLSALRISGWSGTILGMISNPQPILLFRKEDLDVIATPLALALQQAGPHERVRFSLPDPEASYSGDRTTGALFVRGPHLHVVVTDHAAFTRADTGGGDADRDLRDTKGMKLWVAGPARAASLPPNEEPHWVPFETVYVSMNINEVLALSKAPSHQDETLRQIQELNKSNQELRSRLTEQSKQLQEMKDELVRLQQELDHTKAKRPPTRKTPSP